EYRICPKVFALLFRRLRLNDFLEARIAAKRVPAWIETEIAVCRYTSHGSWDCRNFFELLERTLALAGPRVNQCQFGDEARSVDRVVANRQKLNRTPRFADRFFFLA